MISDDAVMVSKNCSIIGEHVVVIFVGDTIGNHNNSMTSQKYPLIFDLSANHLRKAWENPFFIIEL